MRDETLHAAIQFVRPSMMRRLWNWYAKITGWEKPPIRRMTSLRIRSTYIPQ
jgi:hypothetical protein